MTLGIKIVLYSFFAGITVFFGGLLSYRLEKFKDHKTRNIITHVATGFGGGILIAAVAFVLIPKGIENLNLLPLIVLFSSGVFFFSLVDIRLRAIGGAFAQLMSMLMDFIPEAIALGAVFAHNIRLGFLLAIYIGLQNFPESFNGYIELKSFNHSTGKTLTLLFFLSFVGIIAALSGNYFLSDKPVLIAGLMVFSGGGIVFLMFQDIIPLSKLKNSWTPAIGASIGFLMGVIGQKIFG